MFSDKMPGIKRIRDESISPVKRKLRQRTAMNVEERKQRQDEILSPVKRGLRIRSTMGVRETNRRQDELLSPVKRSLRSKEERKGVKRAFPEDISPVLRVKKAKIYKQNFKGESAPVLRAPSQQSKQRQSLCLGKTSTSIPAFAPSQNIEISSLTSAPSSRSQTVAARSTPRSPPQPTPPASRNVCHKCNVRFSSYESLEYHQNLKLRALRKCKISSERFDEDLHLASCPIRTCCFSAADVDGIREHLMKRHRQAGKVYLTGAERNMREVYVILKHSPTEKGVISCPACLRHFNNRNNLIRHQKDTCRGYGQHNCVICAAHFRDRRQMMNHMTTAHPPPPGLTLTGVFMGKPKDRAGERTERSINLSVREPLSQFTFIPEQPIVTSASEFFSPSITEGLTWLIQRARSSSGNSILRLNVSSLIRKGESKVLIPFDTQAQLIAFSVSESPVIVRNR